MDNHTACVKILQMFSDVAPSGNQRPVDVRRSTNEFAWLGDNDRLTSLLFSKDNGVAPVYHNRTIERLAAVDELHRNEQLLRIGKFFLVGRTVVDGRKVRVTLPVMSRAVHLHMKEEEAPKKRSGSGRHPGETIDKMWDLLYTMQAEVESDGDTEFHPDIPHDLQETFDAGSRQWMYDAFKALGFTKVRWARKNDTLESLLSEDSDTLRILEGCAIYMNRDVDALNVRNALSYWSNQPDIEHTSFGTLYGFNPAPDRKENLHVQTPFPLTAAQQEVSTKALHEPVTVLSGAPGNGKSHTLASAAFSAVASGQSVLIATRSQHAADVIVELLERYPGPSPVVFGDATRRRKLITKLSSGLPPSPTDEDIAEAAKQLEVSETDFGRFRQEIVRQLNDEMFAEDALRNELLIPQTKVSFPGAFSTSSDGDEMWEKWKKVHEGENWFRRLQKRRFLKRLGAVNDPSDTEVEDALELARSVKVRARLQVDGGTDVQPFYSQLLERQSEVHRKASEVINLNLSRLDEDARRSITTLTGALRAGRVQRRQTLRQMEGRELVSGLPLWVGTLKDIEDLLPHTAGLFDLLILDETSQVDQPLAATALLRAKRVMVAGDPKQLQHISFVADDDIREAVRKHGLEELEGNLDVRRVNTFDIASSVTSATWLDEHFRSVPHLISFSSERFYQQPIYLVTQTPLNSAKRAVEVVTVDGARDDDGVNAVEIQKVLDVLAEHDPETGGTVGVITPFRAQADAIEQKLLDVYSAADVQKMGLRVGTVHSMQGNEREHMVISFAATADDNSAAVRFAENETLFNVMVTRAKQKNTFIISGYKQGGLVADYVRYAESPFVHEPAFSSDSIERWKHDVASSVKEFGYETFVNYPVGRWHVDVAVIVGDDVHALNCEVLNRNPTTHIDREMVLRMNGWVTHDVFPTSYKDNAKEAAVTTVQRF